MIKKNTPYIYILFFFLILANVFSQEKTNYKLTIISIDSTENTFIKSLNYKKIYSNKKRLVKAQDSILNSLKTKGYFSLTKDSTKSTSNQSTIHVNLGEKIEKAILRIKTNHISILTSIHLKPKNNILILNGDKLQNTLDNISKHLINKGESFSKVKLNAISISSSTLRANLFIERSKKRSINKIIIKGYKNFPTSFLTHFYKITNNQKVTPKVLDNISQKTKHISFVEEFKKPETLFSKDSTILYLYLKKKKRNSFDGLINFNTENKKIKFRGHFDLKMTNAFNNGETINIKWNNNGDERQEFTILSLNPYIFNSKITSKIKFNIYKNDSTFSNSTFNTSLNYSLNSKINLAVLYENENSNTNQQTSNLDNYKKNSLGIGINYQSNKRSNLKIDLNFLIQKRKSTHSKSFKLFHYEISSNFKISDKLNLYIKNNGKITDRKTSLTNELFRSGGANSIRGFYDNSILSNSYNIFNSNLELTINKTNLLYTVHDIGIFNINNINNTFSSIGFGYEFQKKNNRFNINYITPIKLNKDNTNPSIVSIKIITLF